MLFCRQFKQPYGVFRYKNQAAIEADPIEKDGEVIGFQAKFYSNSLSDHTDGLLKTVEKAKHRYPDITKLLIYSNREWAQKNGKPPQGKLKIENRAQELGIQLVWRTGGFFATEFVTSECESISEHFFKFDKGVFDSMEDARQHTQGILSEIQTCFSINDRSFDIDTSEYLERLTKEVREVSILSGSNGVGKTAIIKRLFEQLSDDTPFYVFEATEFKINRINELFPSSSLYSFVNEHKDSTVKIVVIDSAEKLFDIGNLAPFKEFLSALIRNGWQVIFTISNARLRDLYLQFLETHKIVPLHIEIKAQKPSDLQDMSKQYSFALPENKRLLDLIRTPFYLNEYLKHYDDVSGLNYDDFKAELWWRNIAKSKSKRAECFLKSHSQE